MKGDFFASFFGRTKNEDALVIIRYFAFGNDASLTFAFPDRPR